MKLEAMYLISGRGWVATVMLDEGESYSTGDTIQLGGIVWTVRGVELSRPLASSNAPFRQNVGLILRPESINWVEDAKRKKAAEEVV